MKAMKLCLLAVAVMLIASGCLTSPNAFYTAEDVFQDDRIVGDYQEKAEDGFFIRKDPDQKGRYILRSYEGGKTARWVELTTTLFKIGTNSFVDLLPYNDFSIDHVAGVPPSGIDLIRNVTHQRLHVVARITISAFDGPVLRGVPRQNNATVFLFCEPGHTRQRTSTQ